MNGKVELMDRSRASISTLGVKRKEKANLLLNNDHI